GERTLTDQVEGTVADVSNAVPSSVEGLREAAASLGERRAAQAERETPDPNFVAEIERALPKADARFSAQMDEFAYADAYKKGVELSEKASWTPKEATEARVAKREFARQLAEQDLAEAINENREEDARQAAQSQPDQRREPQQPASEAE